MEDLNSLLSELFRLLAIQVALIYNMCGNKAGNQSNAVDQIKSLFNLLAQKNPGNLSSDLGDPVTVHIAPQWEISQKNCISSCKIYRYSTAGQVLMSDSLKSPCTHVKDVLHLHVKWALREQQEVSTFFMSHSVHRCSLSLAPPREHIRRGESESASLLCPESMMMCSFRAVARPCLKRRDLPKVYEKVTKSCDKVAKTTTNRWSEVWLLLLWTRWMSGEEAERVYISKISESQIWKRNPTQ